MSQLAVQKTQKLFIGGEFVRSESGRVFSAPNDTKVPLSSRKDVRDAVVAAKKAQKAWAAKTPYNRGQILYRLAELLESRSEELSSCLSLDMVGDEDKHYQISKENVNQAIDLTVSYAGWADKYSQVASQINPVSGPYFVFSYPEPIGTVALLAPDPGGVLSLLARLLPVIVSGNSAVCLFETAPLARLTLGELFQASDCPAGVVNLLSGWRSELSDVLSRHMGIGALNLAGATEQEKEIMLSNGVENLKRLIAPSEDVFNWTAATSPERITAFCETKTVWHPVGV